MAKKLLCMLLAILMILSFASCTTAPSDKDGTSNEENNPDATKETDPPSDDNAPTDDNTGGDSEDSGGVALGGENAFRVVYAEGYEEAAQALLDYLKMFDKNTSYAICADSEADNGESEILVGPTNRKASADAKATLSTYLDYSIYLSGNKLALYANTPARASAAVEYIATVLKYDDNGLLCYPTGETYINSYKRYTFPDVRIAGISAKEFTIVLPSSATDQEKAAAEEFAVWIGEKAGFILPIVDDSAEATEKEIIIGDANRPECSFYDDKELYTSAIISSNGKLLFYASEKGNYSTAIADFTSISSKNSGAVQALNVVREASAFSGKKAIFIGNSFIYWGGCVTYLSNDTSNDAIRLQGGDKGYFDAVCDANGIDIDVYNYTFGGKNLKWIYENKLNSLSDEFLDSISYVFISEAGENNSNIKSIVDNISKLFKNADEVVYLVHENTVSSNASHILNAIPEFSKNGIKVVNWGELVYDVYKGKVSVEGATQQYNENTFIKNASGSEKMNPNAAVISISGYGDDFHQNPLAGYITAQMCFSTITGISAVGQRYDFCWDKTIAPQYDLENFLMYQYGAGQTSNFIDVFNSAADMRGLQILMDQYINKYN